MYIKFLNYIQRGRKKIFYNYNKKNATFALIKKTAPFGVFIRIKHLLINKLDYGKKDQIIG
jgi:hypothetical protein